MKITTLCNKKENLKNLLQTKADIIAVDCEKFSDKTQTKLTKEEIKELLTSSKKACKEIYVYLDAFIYDAMIP